MELLREPWIWVGRWLGFTVRVVRSFLKNRGILVAGGLSYNALLSLVPLLTLMVATLSLFFEESRILDILRPELRVLLPQHADTLLETAETFLRNKAATSAVSVPVLLFFSSIAFRMLEQAMVDIFHPADPDARRNFWVSALLPYVFIMIFLVALFFLTLVTSSVDALGDRSVRIVGVDLSLAYGVKLLLRVAGFAGLVLLFAGIYYVLPVVTISPRRALVGGLCAAALWRIVGILMVYYFTNISMVNLFYGSLATVIVVLLLMEIAFVILLLGAQVIAELEASERKAVAWYEDPGPLSIPSPPGDAGARGM
jgi:membrane protein